MCKSKRKNFKNILEFLVVVGDFVLEIWIEKLRFSFFFRLEVVGSYCLIGSFVKLKKQGYVYVFVCVYCTGSYVGAGSLTNKM